MSINLHLGDCLEAMRAMPDNAYELAIVDPPYGIKRDGQTETHTKLKKHKRKYFKSKGWDKTTPSKHYFNELKRVSSNQIIWGGNYFVQYLEPSMGWVFWDKGQDLTMSDGELAYTSFQRALRRKVINRSQLLIEGGTIHPTQKPVKLYEWLLDNYAKEGDRILDTHLGSGSIALACHNRGFSLDAYEIDEEYYNAATERLRVHQSQLTIF
jgi:site-specific DNA-methyltransferase (adenine-specific)